MRTGKFIFTFVGSCDSGANVGSVALGALLGLEDGALDIGVKLGTCVGVTVG